MRVRRTMLHLVWFIVAVVGCAPEDKCGGNLLYDPVTTNCRPCPKDATFAGDTCECKEGYAFENYRCISMVGAMPPIADAGPESGAAAASCSDYCDFAKVCLADSALSMSVFPDVIAGLHADDPAACVSSCKTDSGDDGSKDVVVACIDSGRDKAACAGDSTQAGVMGALGLIGECCGANPANTLCKSICKVLSANALLKGQLPFCQ